LTLIILAIPDFGVCGSNLRNDTNSSMAQHLPNFGDQKHPTLIDSKTMKLFSTTSVKLLRSLFMAVLASAFASLSVGIAQSQTIYGVGGAGTAATTFTTLYSVNPSTGATAVVCSPLTFTTAAMGVSSLDGLVYYLEQNIANPRINSINPQTCVNGTPSATTLPTTVIRATSCPDGRFYVMTGTLQFFEINPSTGATIRSLNWTGLVAGGSGDMACMSNGDMYIVAQDGVANYNLYTAPSSSFQNLANGGTAALTNLGDTVLAGAPNGLSEAPLGLAGCAASPNPCLVASTGATNQIWRLNSLTGAATNAGAPGNTLTDLSRSFPVDLTFSKSVTPTVALQGQTVVYTLTVGNPGPGVVRQITVTDTLSAAFSTATWSCSVSNAGSATLVPTSCVTPAGVGNINNTVSLSVNGSLIYKITATLSSTFTGTLTNVGQATMTSLVTDPTPGNNVATVTSTVSPATALTISKTNGTTTLVAGQTTNYTVTVSNLGPANAPNSIVKDPSVTGLSCTSATCTTTGTATCPAGTPAALLAALQSPGGAIIPTFNATATVSFVVSCGVTATGQ
jgi:uncharacterized repeat protein (TIGR01451 family)